MPEKFTLPTENIELPSQGKIYDITNPLSSGSVEMKYMTAREEDILTKFQFLNGSIKRHLTISDIGFVGIFQFLNGSIKRLCYFEQPLILQHFNSLMVRLKESTTKQSF